MCMYVCVCACVCACVCVGMCLSVYEAFYMSDSVALPLFVCLPGEARIYFELSNGASVTPNNQCPR